MIVEKAPKSDAPPIDKKKSASLLIPSHVENSLIARFLVPQEITVGKFVFEIRKHMPALKAEDSIFLFVNDVLPPSGTALGLHYMSIISSRIYYSRFGRIKSKVECPMFRRTPRISEMHMFFIFGRARVIHV